MTEEQAWPRNVQERLRVFARERGWQRFHKPHNLLLALTGEVGELAELYQWSGQGLDEYPPPESVADEVADILIYLLRFADVVGIDVIKAVASKIDRNELRFPIVTRSTEE
jgi:dCTP diphosphatase